MGRKRKPNKHKPPPAPKNITTRHTLLSDTIDQDLLNKWPKVSVSVPPIFVHGNIDLGIHVLKLLHVGINFFKPIRGLHYTKIKLPTYQDHRELSKYLERNRIPFHTFGMPNNRKTKVVVKGLPHETDATELLQELRYVSIPVVRVHKMQTKPGKIRPALFLVVIPQGNEGIRMFQVKKIFGHNVQLEPPREKPEQCHRCQQWGHAQRYCHGVIKCVKCARNHFSSRCTTNKNEEPECANCGKSHTANYKQCVHCPMAPGREELWGQKLSLLTAMQLQRNLNGTECRSSEIVTYENMNCLYRGSSRVQALTEDDSDSEYSLF